MRCCGLIEYYPEFPRAILVLKVRCPCIPHPFATLLVAVSKLTLTFACDLHVLAMPPAFVLSQDQTLQFKVFNLPKKVGSILVDQIIRR